MTHTIDDPIIEWLLHADPAIRWQVHRDLLDSPADVVAAERAAIVADDEGWGAAILELQADDGYWGGSVYGHRRQRDSVMWTLHVLTQFGIDPADPAVGDAIARVRDGVRWADDVGAKPFFAGEVEECVNGGVVGYAAYFGVVDEHVGALAERLVGQRRDDGGWNCDPIEETRRSSFDSTLDVLEGLRAYQRCVVSDGATTTDASLAEAIRTGEEFLLERSLFRRASTGEVANPRFPVSTFPMYWFYDVLRALEYFRARGGDPDPRLQPAIDVLLDQRGDDGRWVAGPQRPTLRGYVLEKPEGQPSRWNTLRALRVLRWARPDAI
ncbi:hypothetical protein [Agromyces sp. LHK192]|uniref:hypothetical protein n=1 Tax=Agromyces sp. LHK192 TaxID=2498704 RepID=UPI000FD7286E|nr:hypothetical protein [Agromyces sp. LHK192]